MNDEMKQQLFVWAKETAELGTTQIPLLVQEALRWYVISNSIGVLFGLLLFGLGLWWKFSATDEDDIGCFVGGITTMWVGFLGYMISFTTLIKISIAPKLFLIELLK